MASSISCELFDYVEIACMFSYRVTLTLDNQKQLTGTPVTTRTTKEKVELLVFKTDTHPDELQEIETNQLIKMQVLTPNARFSEVTFKSA